MVVVAGIIAWSICTQGSAVVQCSLSTVAKTEEKRVHLRHHEENGQEEKAADDIQSHSELIVYFNHASLINKKR